MASQIVITKPRLLQQHFPWKAIDIKTAFFKYLDTRVTVHDTAVRFGF